MGEYLVTSSQTTLGLESITNKTKDYLPRFTNSLNVDGFRHDSNSLGSGSSIMRGSESHMGKDYLSRDNSVLAGYQKDNIVGWIIAAALVIWGIVVLARDGYSLPQNSKNNQYSKNRTRKEEDTKDNLATLNRDSADTYEKLDNGGVVLRINHDGRDYFVRLNGEALRKVKERAKNKGDLEKTLEEEGGKTENLGQSYLTRRLKGYEVKDEEDKGDYDTRKEDSGTGAEEITDENLENVAEADSSEVEETDAGSEGE